MSKGGKLWERFSDPDASWGQRSAVSTRKGKGFYGYKVHAAVCTATGLPVAWETHTARDAEVPVVPTLLDKLAGYGITPSVCIADKGYDAGSFYEACEARNVRPVAPLRMTGKVVEGWAPAPVVRARSVDLRWLRRQAWSGQVPLPLR